MSKATVILSEQDLRDFLEGNQEHMDAYVAELKRRLTEYFGSADVEIDRNALTDQKDVDGERDDNQTIDHIMNQMVNDWSWLPQ